MRFQFHIGLIISTGKKQAARTGKKEMKYYDGCEFMAKIEGIPVKGKITIEDDCVFLCQNNKDGKRCTDKKGFRYSWNVRSGDEEDLERTSVSDFHLIFRDPENYQDWQVGDKIEATAETGEIIFRVGELVVFKYENGEAGGTYTCQELFNDGWRLVPVESEIEPTIELTIEQIAEKFGVDSKQIKIIK